MITLAQRRLVVLHPCSNCFYFSLSGLSEQHNLGYLFLESAWNLTKLCFHQTTKIHSVTGINFKSQQNEIFFTGMSLSCLP